MKKRFIIIYIALLSLIINYACVREDYIEVRDYPRIDLNDNIIQDETGIRFEGFIISRAGEIDDKGFVWDEGTGASMANGSIVSLGPGYETRTFSAKINYGIEKDLSYEVRAFLISEGRTIYSKRVSFVSTISGAD